MIVYVDFDVLYACMLTTIMHCVKIHGIVNHRSLVCCMRDVSVNIANLSQCYLLVTPVAHYLCL